MDFNYDYQKMRRFIEDVSFILQTGSGSKVLASDGSGKFMSILKVIGGFVTLIIYVLIFFCVIYFIYKILTTGYSRFLYNLATFSFKHKINIENFLDENDILYGNFDNLANLIGKDGDCGNPYDIFDAVYGLSKDSSARIAGKLAQKGQEIIQANYSGLTYGKYKSVYRYRMKYQMAFRDFFLYCNVIKNDDGEIVTIYFSPNDNDTYVDMNIKHHQFYVTLISDLERMGASPTINPSKKGALSMNEKMYTMYTHEKILKESNKKTMFQEREEFFNELTKLGQYVKVVANKAMQFPYHHYLVIPSDKTIKNGVIADFALLALKIDNEDIRGMYDPTMLNDKEKSAFKTFKDYNEYTWVMLEVYLYAMLSRKNSKTPPYIEITKLISKIPYHHDRELMNAYLNLPADKRDMAETRLFSKASAKHIDIVKKLPIASRILYSNQENISVSNKPKFYDGVMKLYISLMTGGIQENVTKPVSKCEKVSFTAANIGQMISNLETYAVPYKTLISNIMVIDMYLNEYRDVIIKMIEERNVSLRSFYGKLFNPFVDDYFHNRIVRYWKSFANKKYFKNDLYKRFMNFWDLLEKKLEEMLKRVWGSFNQNEKDEKKLNAQQPQPVAPESDNVDASLEQKMQEAESAEEAKSSGALQANETAASQNQAAEKQASASAVKAEAASENASKTTDTVFAAQQKEQEDKKRAEANLKKAVEENA